MTDAEIATLKSVITTLTGMLPAVVVTPPVVVPVTPPTSAYPATVTLLAVSGKTATISSDLAVIKDKVLIQMPNGRTTNVTDVVLSVDGKTQAITTSEPATDSVANEPGLIGKACKITERYPATTTPPVVTVPPVVVTPPVVTNPTTPSAKGAYLGGINMGALNNNPYVDNSIAQIGTHYRDIEQKYIDKYQALGLKQLRVPIAPERCVDVNKGPLRAGYMAEIKSAFDRLATAGMQAFLDPHSYMRLWTTVSANYVNKYGYADSTYGGVRKLWIPVGAPDCLMDSAGYADFLNKLTAYFAGHPAFLGIGVANEPFSSGADPFNVVTKYFADLPTYIAAISAASKTCNIYLCGGEYGTALNWPTVSDSLKNLADPNGQIVYEAHQYLDGKMYGGGQWVTPDRTEVIPVDNFVNMVKPYVEWLKTNGKRGIIGEMGFPAGNASAAAATVKGLAYTSANGVPVFQWCGGAGWSPDDVNAIDDDNLTYKTNLDPIKAYFSKTA